MANLHDTARELNFVRQALDRSAIVAITDRKGNIVHVNQKFCEISKFTETELLGQNHRIVNSGYHSKEFFVELWKTISSGKVWEGEIRNRAKDGSFYWVYTTIVPFEDEAGVPQQFVSIRYEITAKKQGEEQLRFYAKKLEDSNKELEKSVQKILDREAQILVQDRLASVGLLASSLAHEIGTPLGVIRGRAEYLEMKLQDPEVKKTTVVIVAQIDRVSKLIRSLLNLARGGQVRHMEVIRPKEILEELCELMAHEIRKNQVRVKLEVEDGWEVRGETGPFHQVMLNLLVNSIHAIESAIESGRREEHFIQIKLLDRGESWALAVKDSGTGVSEKNMKSLFQPFFTTKDIGKGTGLGLATSYRILESWGGSIEVESKEGEGATFTLVLPKIVLRTPPTL